MTDERQTPLSAAEARPTAIQAELANPGQARTAPKTSLSFTGCVIPGMRAQPDQGARCYVVQEPMPVKAVSGESSVYFCSACRSEDDPEPTGERLAVKIFNREYSRAYIDDAMQTKLRAFLQSDRADEANILRQIDYGYALDDYYCELYPYCDGGDLRDRAFSYEELMGKIIPEMNTALYAVAQAGFVHRDVKPANIYESKGRYVLADFGIAHNDHSDATAIPRGTRHFVSPEAMMGGISTASDYYSLGITLFDLYAGRHVFEERSNPEVHRMITQCELPVAFPPEHRPLRNLILHLTREEARRLGYEGVKAFLSAPQKLSEPQATTPAFSYQFNGVTYTSPDRLCDEGLLSDWERAKTHLFNNTLKNSLENQGLQDLSAELGRCAAQADRDIQALTPEEHEGYAQRIEDVALMRSMRHMSARHWLCWRGKAYDGLSDLADMLGGDDEAGKDAATGLLMPPANAVLLESCGDKPTLASADGETESEKDFLAYILELATLDVGIARDALASRAGTKPQAGAVEAIYQRLRAEPGDFFAKARELLYQPAFCAMALGWCAADARERLTPLVMERLKMKRSPKGPLDHSEVTLCLELFEACIRDKVGLRTFYLERGDRADFVWLRKNLSAYVFDGVKALALYRRLSDFRLPNPETDAIASMDAKLDEGMSLLADFHKLFRNNMFLAALNVRDSAASDGITSFMGSAYFVYDFWGRPAPAGLWDQLQAQTESER